jgi:hypothetical protein
LTRSAVTEPERRLRQVAALDEMGIRAAEKTAPEVAT